MKCGNTSKWKNIENCKDLLLFAELIDELLFDYSIPSNRIATLNSRSLCIDALRTINTIEESGVPNASLKPIVEELYDVLKKDPVFVFAHENPLRFFLKHEKDTYRVSNNPSELGFDECKQTVDALYEKYFKTRWYLDRLEESIKSIIISNDHNWTALFRMTKAYLTELSNRGYDLRFIYDTSKKFFFSDEKPIEDPSIIEEFFKIFNCKANQFIVYFVVNSSFSSFARIFELTMLESMDKQTGAYAEEQFLKISKKKRFLKVGVSSLDPFSAATKAKNLLNDNIALFRICDHAVDLSITKAKCGVYSSENSFWHVQTAVSPVSKAKMPPWPQIKDTMNKILNMAKHIDSPKRIRDLLGLINAANFHALSLDSNSTKNQLLDMWAIFETVLNISNEHTMDRINQVCQYLVPILKKKYLYSLFLQLASDIKNYNETEYQRIIGSASTEREIVNNVCCYTLLDDYSESRNEFLALCTDFPLLSERIQYYHDVLSSPGAIYDFVEKHGIKVRWQIMRIYRNRNLIIHNGDSSPYLGLLIENLHSYVDVFFDYLLLAYAQGNSLETMCQVLFAEECEWVETFKNKRKVELTEELLATALSR